LTKWYRPAHELAVEWVKKRNDGDSAGAFLDTLPPDERQKLWKASPGRLVLGSFFLGGDWAGEKLPGFKTYLEKGELLQPDATGSNKLLRTEQFQAIHRDRMDIVEKVTQRFRDRTGVVLRPPEAQGWWRVLDADKGIVQMFLPMGLLIVEPGKEASSPLYNCDAAVIVENVAGPISIERDPGWRVVGVQLIRGGKPAPTGSPGPGEAMGN